MMKLKKSLYRLRQSPKHWFGKISQGLGDIEFRPLKSDPGVYIYEDGVGFVILTLYVDDLFLLGANILLLNKIEKQMMNRFEMMAWMTCREFSAWTSPVIAKMGSSALK